MRAVFVVVLALSLVVLLPEAAWACPVCFDSSDENRQAFIATTVFLSLLPLGMVAGAGLYVRKRSRDLTDESSNSESLD
jgi:hypothetical protein